MSGCKLLWLLLACIGAAVVACQRDTSFVQPHQGDLAKTGGSPTVRKSFQPIPDDPDTTNDESNDQPPGHFGTLTMAVSSLESGNSYTLDVELDGTAVERVYFPKGGWVDFYSCELDNDLTGTCLDEEGRSWTFDGESSSGASGWVEEDEASEEDGEGDNGTIEGREGDGDEDPPTPSANKGSTRIGEDSEEASTSGTNIGAKPRLGRPRRSVFPTSSWMPAGLNPMPFT